MKYPAAMIVLLSAPLVSAPPPRVVREIDLDQIVPPKPGFASFASFTFSPDENWVAVAVGARPVELDKSHGSGAGSVSLLMVPLNGTGDQPVRIDTGLRAVPNPAWSPDSAAVLVEGFDKSSPLRPPPDGTAKVWNLRGDELLSRHGPGLIGEGPVGGIFGFLDSQHLLTRRMPAKGIQSAFETIDLAGQVVDMWTVPKHWTVADISPERGLLAVLPEGAAKTLVIDHLSKKVILTTDNPHGFQSYLYGDSPGGSWQYFTESGKTLCSVGSVGTDQPALDTITECWDVDSGRKIAQFHGFRGGVPAAASSHASRLLLTHQVAFPRRSEVLIFPGGERVVWDFRSGGEIAAWEVPYVAGAVLSHIGGADLSHRLDHVAISSSGRYAAETSGTLLRIYELP